jgi:hypothetical protein
VLRDYSLPWYFYLVSAQPLGIPIVTLGGAIPAVLGVGLAAGCLGIVVVLGYLVVFALLVLAVRAR